MCLLAARGEQGGAPVPCFVLFLSINSRLIVCVPCLDLADSESCVSLCSPTRLPVSNRGSTQLDIDEDDSHALLQLRKLKFDFKFFDATFTRLKVSSNGYLTFGPMTKPNKKGTTVKAHFRDPKIAGLTMDFDLSDSKSKIFYKYDEDMDAVVIPQ